jgi:hypothetical protein
MKNLILLALAGFMIAMSCSGCASIIRGPHEQIGLSSSPIGVTATVNGMTYTTPVMVELPRKKNHIVVFEKEGYETASGTIQSSTSAFWAWNFLMFGYGAIIGIPIDFASGATYNLSPDTVHITLQKEE